MTTKMTAWMWIRGASALVLAVGFGAATIAHNGFRVGNATCIVGYMTIALASIYVAMWKRWDFEIVGWALLATFIVGMAMS